MQFPSSWRATGLGLGRGGARNMPEEKLSNAMLGARFRAARNARQPRLHFLEWDRQQGVDLVAVQHHDPLPEPE